MAESANPGLRDEVAAAIAWWRDAGVDACFSDEPVNWLAAKAKDEASRAGAGKAHAVLLKAAVSEGSARDSARATADEVAFPALPAELDAFRDWWLAEPKLDAGRTSDRVPPRGEAGAEVMIVVPEPEREDSDRLLSGPQGRLLDAMLGAMGIAPERAYFASALPRHTPMADWPALAASGHGAVLRRHVALVAPRLLIAFGSNVLPLLGHDLPKSGQFFTEINLEGCQVPLWTAADLGAMLARPRAKARVWQQFLDLGLAPGNGIQAGPGAQLHGAGSDGVTNT